MVYLDVIMVPETQKIKDGLEFLLKDSSDKGQQRVLLSLMTSVKDLEDTCNKRYSQAYIDSLTNIPNRRAVDEKLEEYVQESEKTGINFTYMNIDIKDFKKFNDLYGEEVGDQKLKDIANLLDNEVRDFDFVGRHGGDEYTVLLKNINIEDSLKKAKCIKDKALARYDVELHIGIANYTESTKYSGQIKSHSCYARQLSKEKGEPVVYESENKGKDVHVPLITPVLNYFKRHREAKKAARQAYDISMRNSGKDYFIPKTPLYNSFSKNNVKENINLV